MMPDPETYPTPSQWADAVAALRNKLMHERRRAFPAGTTRRCPSCGQERLESRDDIMRETIVGAMALVHHNLHGARCSHCGAEFLESYEEISLEEAGPARTLSDYQAKVTSVSGRNLGTYWPKDVVRAMDLHNQDTLRVQVLDRDTMLIARRHEHP